MDELRHTGRAAGNLEDRDILGLGGVIDRGESNAAWTIRALKVGLSAAPDSLKMFTSDRISGFGLRLAGLAVLWRIRWFRCGEMLRQARKRREATSFGWNRAA